jgi:hypothetical protein
MRCTARGQVSVTGGLAPPAPTVEPLQELLNAQTAPANLAWWTLLELDKLYVAAFMLKEAIWAERTKRCRSMPN